MYMSFTGGKNDYYRGVYAELKRNNPDFNEIFEMGVKRGEMIAEQKAKTQKLIVKY